MTEATHIVDGVSVGEVLAGKYLLERTVGQGGMAVVAAARHIELDTQVAIKFLLPSSHHDTLLRQRFEREARATVRIRSEHIARVLDVDSLPNGSPYIVMEFLDGIDLARRLQQTGPMDAMVVAEYARQACDAIGHAHDLGIVHRDVKPANLFLARAADGTERVKVLDFGISKSALTDAGDDCSLTRSRATLGSPLYMSPEQMASASTVDGRTDLWALGVTMFELLTGELPFAGKNVPEICLAVTQTPTPSLRHRRPEIPDALVQIVERCLEKERSRRWSTAWELRDALDAFCRGQEAAPSLSPLPRLRFTDKGVVIKAQGAEDTQDDGATERETMPEPIHAAPSGGARRLTWRRVAFGAMVLLALAVGAGAGIKYGQSGGAAVRASPTSPPSAAAAVAPPGARR